MEPMSLERMKMYIAASPFIRDWGIEVTAADAARQTLNMRMPWCIEGSEADGKLCAVGRGTFYAVNP